MHRHFHFTSYLFRLTILLLPLFTACSAVSQDVFEIRVEEYERPALGELTLEQHVNYAGTNDLDVISRTTDNRQLHMSYELTGGIAEFASVGAMILTTTPRGSGTVDYVGWRLLSHFYLPETWRTGLKLGMTVELSFGGNFKAIELRPVLEKRIGDVQIDINPAVEAPLARSGALSEWEFEPSARIGYLALGRIEPNLEYYGSIGKLTNPSNLHDQAHQIYPGLRIRLLRNISLDVGVGIGLTSQGGKLLYKTRIEIPLTRRKD